MINLQQPRYALFHHWLILVGLIAFAAWLAFDSGIYAHVVANDPSRLSLVISVLFALATVHCGVLSLRLAREAAALADLLSNDDSGSMPLPAALAGRRPDSLAASYLRAVAERVGAPGGVAAGEYTQLTEVLAERVRGQHEAGWFVTNMLVKLGLLGTVIGFILMLSSVMSIDSFDISEAQGLLGTMTVGMGVALNTTMLGLVCSMLLGMQYLLVDRGADGLIAGAVFVAESQLVPALARENDGVQA